VAISHIYKDAWSLAQTKSLPSLIYHEPAIEVRFVRGSAGRTRILTLWELFEFEQKNAQKVLPTPKRGRTKARRAASVMSQKFT